jgi:hypothetical protein
MQAKRFLPVFMLVALFPYLAKSQCTFPVNAGPDAIICRGTTKTLTAVPSGGVAPYTYLWSNSLGTTLSVSVTNSGNTSVIVTDANGCIGKDTVAVSVLDTSVFTIEVRPDTALFLSCNNKNVIVKALPDGVLPVSDFTWNTGETAQQFITVYQTGTYDVTVTAVNGCKSRRSLVVTQNLAPPNVSVQSASPNTTLDCRITTIILEGRSTTPSATFRWNTGATNTSIGATTAGIYTRYLAGAMAVQQRRK